MRLKCYQSTVHDGTMKESESESEAIIRHNRVNFLKQHDLSEDMAVLVNLEYGGDNYRRYASVDKRYGGDGITRASSLISDSLFTDKNNLALFLPLADCIGAVLYSPKNQAMGVAHLGRHNLIQEGGIRNIEYGSSPQDITVFLSAAAGNRSYPLYDFENRSLHEVAVEQLVKAGVLRQNIDVDRRDTTSDESLFSHSNFLAGTQETDGRHAIVAIMR